MLVSNRPFCICMLSHELHCKSFQVVLRKVAWFLTILVRSIKANITWIPNLRPWQTRKHCCGNIVADANVSPFARARNICCGFQKHLAPATNVSPFARRNICVRNNVSSFATALTSYSDSQGTSISRTSTGNETELVREIGKFEISGVKITVKQVQGKKLLVRVIGVFEKSN